MAFSLDSTAPTPAPTVSDAQILSMLMGAQGGGGGQDQALVPLWLVKPSAAPAPKLRRGRAGEIDYETYNNRMDFRSTPMTKGGAEAYWFDMSDEDRRAFAEKATKAGIWEPKDGAAGLAQAWGRAVDMAASYNAANPDKKDKWVSPWEAVEKLYAAGVAAGSGSLDGFKPYTGWRTSKYKQVKTFTSNEIAQTAQQILQQELGRDPTKAEINAYTIAANKAAVANPQLVTESSRDTAWDESGRPIDSETSRTVEGDTFDPSLTIQGMARGTQEHKNVKAATDYFSAAMQALNSIV